MTCELDKLKEKWINYGFEAYWAKKIKDYEKHKCNGIDGSDIGFTKKDFERMISDIFEDVRNEMINMVEEMCKDCNRKNIECDAVEKCEEIELLKTFYDKIEKQEDLTTFGNKLGTYINKKRLAGEGVEG